MVTFPIHVMHNDHLLVTPPRERGETFWQAYGRIKKFIVVQALTIASEAELQAATLDPTKLREIPWPAIASDGKTRLWRGTVYCIVPDCSTGAEVKCTGCDGTGFTDSYCECDCGAIHHTPEIRCATCAGARVVPCDLKHPEYPGWFDDMDRQLPLPEAGTIEVGQ
jgi:hypothetical protein